MATAASTTTSCGGSHRPPINNYPICQHQQQQGSQREVATAASTTTSSGGSQRPPWVVATAASTTTSCGGSHRPPNNQSTNQSDNKTIKPSNIWKSNHLAALKHIQSIHYFWTISSIDRNKAIKTTNGNGSKVLKVTHWNMGSSHWVNQIPEINLLIANKDPDLAIFSEANIFSTNQDYELHVPGYSLILPKTMDLIGNCRVAILVKDGIDVQVLDKFMDTHIASIWLKISAKGNKIIHLSAIYRQHMWIKQPLPNNTKHPAQQYARWKDFITQWIASSRGAETFVIGDTNLDHNKWAQPDGDHINMTNLVKTQIETLGFHQMVTGSTRFWPGTRPSLVDKCWTNCPERLLKIIICNISKSE